VLTSDYFSKYEAAIKAKKEDYENELPAEVSQEVVDKLVKFVSVKETDHITAKYEAQLTELSASIDANKKERGIEDHPKNDNAVRKARKSKKSSRRNSVNSDASNDKEVSLEDQLKAVLNEVQKRTDSVRFSKDDFESLSDAQSQLDAFFSETTTAILRMKQGLRKRFDRVQTRKPRSRKEKLWNQLLHHPMFTWTNFKNWKEGIATYLLKYKI